MNEFFFSLPNPSGHIRPQGLLSSNRNEYHKQRNRLMFLESRAWPVRRADNHTAISEPIVYTMWYV
jgi:hypothetical protein